NNSDGTYGWAVWWDKRNEQRAWTGGWGKRKRVIRWRVGCRKEPVAGRDVLVGEHSVHHRYHTD
ncbi:hypothetical protein ALC56_07791, partial [Trachymyrmex septentrionalis]